MYELFDSILSVDVLDILAQKKYQVGEASPPGLGDVMTLILGWTKWIAIFCGVGGIFVIAIMMMVGRRNRSQMAADGMSALPWIVGGFLLIGLSATFAEWLVQTGEEVTVNEIGLNSGSSGSGSSGSGSNGFDSVFTGELGEAETLDDFYG